jgi:hypothetical protein
VEFQRLANNDSAARTFDIEMVLKSGEKHTFISVARSE